MAASKHPLPVAPGNKTSSCVTHHRHRDREGMRTLMPFDDVRLLIEKVCVQLAAIGALLEAADDTSVSAYYMWHLLCPLCDQLSTAMSELNDMVIDECPATSITKG